ncbi:MAG: urease accessory protein [Betaproteobacteria bacterium]|nr:MAG: urease accessory protein [Betaproteobacteria bacterium]
MARLRLFGASRSHSLSTALKSYNRQVNTDCEPSVSDAIARDGPTIQGWTANLTLKCQMIQGKSILTERVHHGPLRLLKPLYPEGDRTCHAVIVHPPGGIVAGDVLGIEVDVQDAGHLLVTTPGTQKWYRSLGRSAESSTSLTVGAGSSLEWLPQETMVFDRARVSQRLSIRINQDARFFGWEILCLGRTTRNETFTQGSFRQRIELIRDGSICWSEQTLLQGDDPLLRSMLGFQSMPVVATAWIAYPPREDAEAEALLGIVRAHLMGAATAAASQPAAGLIVIKIVGASPETVRLLLATVWSRIREDVFGVAAQLPRIWST